MSFSFPWFLAALVFAAIPIVLYLLFRMRKQNVEWGATYILQLTLQEKVRESRWRQYIVLAVRTLILVLLVAAFAGPLLRMERPPGGKFPRGGSGALTRVVLLDNSLSMKAEYGSGTRLSEARRLAAELLEDARGGDSFLLLTTGEDDEPIRIDAGSRRKKIGRKLAGLKSAKHGGVTRALEKAYRHFLTTRTPNRQLVFLTDFAAIDFREPEALRPVAKSFLQQGVDCYFHVLGNPKDTNSSLISAGFGTDFPLVGQAYNLHVQVANYGNQPCVGDRLLLLENGKVFAHKDYDLLPNETKSLTVPLALPAGEHNLELRVGEDIFPADNYLNLAVSVRESLPVMILAPAEDKQKGFESQSEFLARVLRSSKAAEGNSTITIQRRTPGNLTEDMLRKIRVVVAAGAGLAQGENAGQLKDFLTTGGGLVFAPGPDTELEACAPTVEEIFGVRMTGAFTDKIDHDRYRFAQRSELEDDLLREFTGDLNADLSKGRIYNHYRVEMLPDSASRILVRLSNGDPLLLAARYRRGTAILCTSPFTGTWNSLVVRQSFLPLVYRLLDIASAGSAPSRNLREGKPIICCIDELPSEGRAEKLYVATPDKTLEELRSVKIADKSYVRYDSTSEPGLYNITDKRGNVLRSYTVSGKNAESDMRPLDEKSVQMLGNIFSTDFTRGEADLRGAMVTAGYSLMLTTWVVAVLGGLLLLETLLLRVWF
ncbi:MAG: BatA domain-containing protein [Planctomycetes bacterium]|nr:BatA domain-containing protein [Planctomycetota bacterium]